MESITAESRIKGIPVTCQTPDGMNPFTCSGVYTVDAVDNMSGTFIDQVRFSGTRRGGGFEFLATTSPVTKVGGGPVVMSVESSPRPSTPGQNVTVTASVSSMGCNSGLMPPGTLQVSIGPERGVGPLIAEEVWSPGGTVSFTTSALPPGSHAVTASYAGGNGCAAGSATGLVHVVEARPTASVAVNPQVGDTQSFAIGFSAPVSGLTANEIDIVSTAGAVTHVLTGSGAAYTLTLTGMTQSGSIVVRIPENVAQTPAGSQNLASTTVNASYVKGPVITSVTPSSGSAAGGYLVTITGTRFDAVSSVKFAGVEATTFVVDSSTRIRAVAPASVPPNTPGTASIEVTTASGTSPANALFTYRVPQSITFTDPADITAFVPNLAVPLVASSTSRQVVRFASMTPLVCSVAGTTATVIAAGECTVAADLPESDLYYAAPQVSQSFKIAKASQTITFTKPADIPAFTPNQAVTLSASATSGLAVGFMSTSPSVCSVADGTATVLTAGICSLMAYQAGDDNYLGADPVNRNFLILKANQTITFAAPADRTFTQNLIVTLTASATSGQIPVLVSTTPAVCTVAGRTAIVHTPGTCSITAHETGNISYNPATDVSQSFVISKGSQSIDFTAPADIAVFVPNQLVNLTASATSGLPVSLASASAAICSVSGTQATILAAGTCVLTADQPGDAYHDAAAQVSRSFSIAKADQSIAFTSTPPATVFVDGPAYTVTATGGPSSSPVLFSIAAGSAAVCTVSGNVVNFTGEGSCMILANQAADGNFNASPEASQTIAVSRQAQVITFTSTPPARAVAGGTPYLVSASGGGSGNPVLFAIDAGSAGICAISGNSVSFLAAGSCVINASQAGNAAFADAAQLQQSFSVAANTPPVANAGPDQTNIAPGASVTLNGSGSSDPDAGQVLSFAWVQSSGTPVSLSGANTASPGFTAPMLDPGVASVTLIFALTVSDSAGASHSDTVSVTVADMIAPSVAITGMPADVTPGGSFTVDILFSEPVTGFTQSDIAVTNGSVTGFAGSGAAYSVTVTASGAGTVQLGIAAGAAEDNAGNPSLAAASVSVSLTATEETEQLLEEEALARNTALLASQPDLSKFLSDQRGGLTVSTKGTALSFDLATDPDRTLWILLSGRTGNGAAALDHYVHSTVGAHLLKSETFILGAMVQVDQGKLSDGIGYVEGNGWMAGPYFVARFSESNLLLSGSFLAGEADIEVSPLGSYVDMVTSDRRLVTFSFVKELKIDRLLLRPRLDIARVTENRPSYVDGLGNTIAAGDLSLTEASAGVDFETSLAVDQGSAWLSGGFSAIHAEEKANGVSDATTRGRIDLGLKRDFGNGSSIMVNTSYDGIGASEKGSLGLDFLYNLRF